MVYFSVLLCYDFGKVMNFYSEYEYWVTIINSVVSDSTDISLCLQVSS